MVSPIVQDRGVEIRSVGPDDRSDLVVNSNAREKERITKWSVDFSFEHIGKIDCRFETVIKPKAERIRCDGLAFRDADDRVSCVHSSGLIGAATRPAIS